MNKGEGQTLACIGYSAVLGTILSVLFAGRSSNEIWHDAGSIL